MAYRLAAFASGGTQVFPYFPSRISIWHEGTNLNKNEYSFSYDIVRQKMAVINSVDDGIMKATKGAIRSAMLLLNKTKDYEFDVFRTLNGQVQINYYSSVEKPLEVYVSYCHFEVLFPDDEEKEYKKIDSVFNVITAYFEGANSV